MPRTGKRALKTTKNTSGVPAPNLIQSGTLDSVVSQLTVKYGSISGVIRIIEGFIMQGNAKLSSVEIHVLDQNTLNNLKNVIGATAGNFPVNYLINTLPKLHYGIGGDGIYNIANIKEPGTLGCFAKKTGTDDIYLVSALHVLKGDQNWFGPIGSNVNIIDCGTNTQVATLIEGSLTSTFDVGFAIMSKAGEYSNASLGIKFAPRPLTNDDSFNETSVIFNGAASGIVSNAVVYKDTIPISLPYPSIGNFPFTDLFSITIYNSDGSQRSPSNPGDSGSAVIDNNGYPLGIIVGGDALYTYVAKFSNILLGATSPYNQYSVM